MSIDPPKHALRTSKEFRALVEDVSLANPSAQETDWLEWKCGDFDIEMRGDQFAAAKYILSFANREPRHASRQAEGCAYLLIGVEPQSALGVKKVIDAADLESQIAKYVGVEGPRWQPNYVTFDGRDFILITIEAPAHGSPLFPLRKGYATPEGKSVAVPGDIFIRRNGKSVKANAEEIDMLSSRAGSATRGAIVEVTSLVERPLLCIEPVTASVNDFVAARTKKLLAPLVSGRYQSVTQPLTIRRNDPREEEDFREDVAAYGEALHTWAISTMYGAAISEGVVRVKLSLTNESDETLENVDFRIDPIDRALVFRDVDDVPDYDENAMPKPPRAWGSQQGWAATSAYDPHRASSFSPIHIPRVRPIHRDTSIDGHTYTYRQRIGDLQPRRTEIVGPFHLFVGAEFAGKEFVTPWSVTANNASGIVEGTVALPVDAESISAERFLNSIAGGSSATAS